MRDMLTVCSDILVVSKSNDANRRQELIKKLLGEILVGNTTICNKSNPNVTSNKITDSVLENKKFLEKLKSELSNDPTKKWCIDVIDHTIANMMSQDKTITDLSTQLVEINELCNKIIGVSTSCNA